MAKTIAAISTPLATGGIAVVRISGEQAFAVADQVFSARSGAPLAGRKGYTAAFGTVCREDGQQLDTSIATVFHAPHSYTGEDVVELSCHGGILIARLLLRAVIAAGASLAEPGEFTKRAFLNGKLDLTQAEAVADMLSAKNTQALDAARSQLNGSLYRRLSSVKQNLLSLAGHLSAWADYPEEDIPALSEQELTAALSKVKAALSELLSTFDAGRLLREGIDTVIVGKPNVGKSTLMNLLSGCERSIVTEIAGTTRDVVEETILLGDYLLRLSDTAGLRQTQDRVEQLGVSLARDRLDQAQLVLAVFDSSLPLDEEDYALLDMLGGKAVIPVVNKADLPLVLDLAALEQRLSAPLLISAKADSSGSLAALEGAVGDRLPALRELDAFAGILTTERQRDCAERCLASVEDALAGAACGGMLDGVTVSVEDALSALLELTGERATEAVVNDVFSHFCVGK